MDYERGNSREGRRGGYTYRNDRYSRDESQEKLLGYAEKIMTHTDDEGVIRAAKMLMKELNKD